MQFKTKGGCLCCHCLECSFVDLNQRFCSSLARDPLTISFALIHLYFTWHDLICRLSGLSTTIYRRKENVGLGTSGESAATMPPFSAPVTFRYLIHIKINRFFKTSLPLMSVADQIPTGPDLSAYTVCLSAPIHVPYSSTKAILRQMERQTQRLTVSHLVPHRSLYAECSSSVYLAHSLVEYLCNRTQGWSSSNHGRIIKTCWSLQSWKRGRFINDTLTTAFGLQRT